MTTELARLSDNWKLTIVENATVLATGFDPKTPEEAEQSPHLTIPASVPGNFELDLFRAGIMEDPFFGENPIKCQALENRHLWYSVTFDCPNGGDPNTYLAFDGIDTIADIYLNGEFLAHSENMLIGYTYNVPHLKEHGNTLVVHITPAVIYARNFPLPVSCNCLPYNFESLLIRKAPSMYGWDIMPRFVSGGIWKPVRLVRRTPNHIEDVFLWTKCVDLQNSSAILRAFIHFKTEFDSLQDMTITLDSVCGDSVIHCERRPFHTAFQIEFWAGNVQFWWPKNAGQPALYNVTVRLWKNGTLLDEYHLRAGIRTVQLIRTSCDTPDGEGDFHFEINGKPIFCLGTNWVPLDSFHSRDITQLPSALALMDDIGCNTVRVWGGNVYENDEFYNFCDEKGIMVWQDFMMGCAIYPENDRFIGQMKEESAAVVQRLRQHPSLILWAGDNECDYGRTDDPNNNYITRKLLPHICRLHDPSRPFLPSSPYFDEEAYKTGKPTSEDHLWGPRDYFNGEYYQNTVCHFASETGYHACNSPVSLKRFIRPEHLWPNERNGETDADWLIHCSSMEAKMDSAYAYRIRLMTSQVKTLFGQVPDDLDTYVRMSQISQAEAMKYFIERFRMSKWRRSGIIWWNIIDGWPQISDAVVDYYRVKKLAYHFIKRAQNPICLMMDEPKDGKLALYAVNDTPHLCTVPYTVRDLHSDAILLQGTIEIPADSSIRVADTPTAEVERMLLIEWDHAGKRESNHYTTHTLSADYANYMHMLQKAGYDQFEGFEG